MEGVFDKLFAKEEINTGRQVELDITKAICIFFMVIIHALIQLPNASTGETESISYFLITVLCNFTGAGAFMICMGVGFNYTKHNDDYKHFITRGISTLAIAYILNFVRSLFFIFVTSRLTSNFNYHSIVYELLRVDILQFAGLSMVVFGIFKKMGIKPHNILIFAIVCSVFATLIEPVTTNNAILDGIIGLIFPNKFVDFEDPISEFSFLNWFVLPAFGYYFSDYIKRVKNKKVFWGFHVCLAIIIFSIYALVAMEKRLGLFSPNDIVYYHISAYDVWVNVFCSLGLIGLIYFISLILPENIKKINTIISTNINQTYCIHWVILYWINDIYKIIFYMTHKSINFTKWPEWTCIVIGVVVFIVSAYVAACYSKYKEARK